MNSTIMNARPSYMPKYWPVPSDCVLYLEGQQDAQSATIKDLSGLGNNGTIVGATWTRDGKGLWYLDFSGTDQYIDCGTDASVLPDAYSFECWLKVGVAINPVVGFTGAGAAVPAIYAPHTADNLLRLYQADTNRRYFDRAPVDFADSKWHHLMVVTTGVGQNDIDNSAAYADGQALTVSSTTKTIAVDAKDELFVAKSGSLETTGGLALVRLYNVAKAQAFAAGHYAQERHLFGV